MRAHHTRRLRHSTLKPSPPSTLVVGREISDSLLNNFPLDFNDQGAASPHPSQTRPCPKAALQPPANDTHSRRPPLAQATALKKNNQHTKLEISKHDKRSPQKKATPTKNIGALQPVSRSHQKKVALTKIKCTLFKWLAALCVLNRVGAATVPPVTMSVTTLSQTPAPTQPYRNHESPWGRQARPHPANPPLSHINTGRLCRCCNRAVVCSARGHGEALCYTARGHGEAP